MADIIGDEENNILTGTPGDDLIDGLGGQDEVRAGDGNDTVNGGAGNDGLMGEGGDDTLNGDADADVLVGGAGLDTLNGGDGNDILHGSAANLAMTTYFAPNPNPPGPSVQMTQYRPVNYFEDDGVADVLNGGAGDDTVYALAGDSADGGDGVDTLNLILRNWGSNLTLDLSGGDPQAMLASLTGGTFANFEKFSLYLGNFNNTVTGTAGDDSLLAFDGDDVLSGGGGNDFLHGGLGSDNLSGGEGTDTLYANNGLNTTNFLLSSAAGEDYEVDTLDGGLGNDTFYFGLGDVVDGGDGTDTAHVSFLGADGPINLDLNGGSAAVMAFQGGTITNVERFSIWGSRFDDVLVGDGQVNNLSGDDGDDYIDGGASGDLTRGALGRDTLHGGDGNDLVFGGEGADTLHGGLGNDQLNGDLNGDTSPVFGRGPDTVVYAGNRADYTVLQGDHRTWQVSGPDGTDLLYDIEYIQFADQRMTLSANPGEVIDGDGGDNFINGTEGQDDIRGHDGNDNLFGLGENDTLTGGAGHDYLDGGEGHDRLQGGSGDDRLEGGLGDDVLDGGTQTGWQDIASYGTASSAVTVDLALQGVAQDTGAAGWDTLIDIEGLSGGNFDDTLRGDGGDNYLWGGDGNDVLEGREGNDILEGHLGTDVLDGGDGAHDMATYYNAAGGVTVDLNLQGFMQNTGAAGWDTLIGIENIAGSHLHGDTLTGDGLNNYIDGDGGNDILHGGAGWDHLRGGEGDDALYGGSEDDTLTGGLGDDLLDGGAGDQDRADYWEAAGGVTVNLSINGAQNTGQGLDTLVGVENVTGSNLGGDTLTGDGNNNNLSGVGGDDVLDGAGGHDYLSGGDGNDIIQGGDGDDTLRGDLGDDVLTGGAGTDRADYYSAANGVTVDLRILTAQDTGEGMDTISGVEQITGSQFGDVLNGDDGQNYIDGQSGDDQIFGNGGSDNLRGADGNDVLSGGADNDYLDGGAGDDVMDGGAGTGDMAQYGSATSGVTVSLLLQGGAQDTGGAGLDTLTGFEQLGGSAHNDVLTGDNANNFLSGEGGDDLIYGNGGSDNVNAGDGNDTVYGGTENDFIHGGAGDDVLDGGAGTGDMAQYYGAASGVQVSLMLQGQAQNTGAAGWDTLTGFEQLGGSAHDDVLTGDNLNNFLNGADGNDVLNGEGGNDNLQGNLGSDTLYGGAGFDTAVYNETTTGVTVDLRIQGQMQNTGAAGWDTYYSIENATGGSGADTLIGDATSNFLSGNAGNDLLVGNEGDDTLTGGLGDDTIEGGAGGDTASYGDASNGVTVSLALQGAAQNTGWGNDTLTGIEYLNGSNFNDTLTGDAFDNSLNGGAGADTLSGGDGDDALRGQLGDDIISGGDGNDFLTGGSGNDVIDGGEGIDRLSVAPAANEAQVGTTLDLRITTAQDTGHGMDTVTNVEHLTGSVFNDVLTGNEADNFISGRGGLDTLSGDAGDDVMEVGDGDHVLDGGADHDTASFNFATTAVNVSLEAQGGVQDIGAGQVTLTNFESLSGTDYDDTLTGDDGDNTLSGSAGNDTLVGGAGADALYGDGIKYQSFGVFGASGPIVHYADVGVQFGDPAYNGADTIDGGDGNDLIVGAGGDDQLTGGAGDDTIDGGADTDTAHYAGLRADYTLTRIDETTWTVSGPEGTDTLTNVEFLQFSDETVSLAVNTINGTEGPDSLIGTPDPDVINGLGGDDQILGGNGDDELDGGADHDFVAGGLGNDIIRGGAGDDFVRGNDGDDLIDGGEGNDRAAFSLSAGDAQVGVTVDLRLQGTAQDTGHGMDTLIGIENVSGNQFDDVIIGDDNNNWLWGGSNGSGVTGNDVIDGQGGDDLIQVGSGNHDLKGGEGVDTVSFNGNSSDITSDGVTIDLTLQGGSQDTEQGVTVLEGFENVSGSTFADLLTGDDNANTLAGFGGDDTLNGGAGADLLLGDGVVASSSATGYSGPAAVHEDASVTYENPALIGNDTLNGGDGDDRLVGGNGDDSLDGGADSDTAVYFGLRADYTVTRVDATTWTVSGPEGTDTLTNVEFLQFSDELVALAASIDGTEAGEYLNGTEEDDVIRGFGGDDYVDGFAGNDDVEGGDGNDQLFGWDGDDHLQGGAGADYMGGNWGNDHIEGGEGDDYLRGNEGDDILDGGDGIDRAAFAPQSFDIQAGATVDLRLQGVAQDTGHGMDTLIGVEHVSGTYLDDVITGDDGANWLWGGSNGTGVTGNDVIDGQGGDDLIQVGTGNHDLRGGDGIDTVSFHGNGTDITADGVTVDLRGQGASQDTEQGLTVLEGFENVSGSAFADTLTGDDTANTLAGYTGDDTLSGEGGDDVLLGDGVIDTDSPFGYSGPIVTTQDVSQTDPAVAGNDTLSGGDGNDTLVGGNGDDSLDGGAGSDTAVYFGVRADYTVTRIDPTTWTVTGPEGTDTVTNVEFLQFSDELVTLTAPIDGTEANDTLTGTENDDVMRGLGGDDYLDGLAGNDDLQGGDGNDQAYGWDGDDHLQGGDGSDALGGNWGNDHLEGGAGNDYLRGNEGDDIIDGGDGFDRAAFAPQSFDIQAGATVDLRLQGVAQDTGHGMDTLIGIEHVSGTYLNDVITGDDGDNWLWGGSNGTGVTGDDVIDGQGGDDLIQVGTGAHTLTGGDGIDTVSYNGNGTDITAAGVEIDLTLQGGVQDTRQGLTTLEGFENVSGSRSADVLTGDANANTLAGFGGDDELNGGGGDDVLLGDGVVAQSNPVGSFAGPIATFQDSAVTYNNPALTGADVLNGGDGNDRLVGGRGDDTLDGGDGGDTAVFAGNRADYSIAFGAGGVVTVTGPDGTDTVTNVEAFEFDDETVDLIDLIPLTLESDALVVTRDLESNLKSEVLLANDGLPVGYAVTGVRNVVDATVEIVGGRLRITAAGPNASFEYIADGPDGLRAGAVSVATLVTSNLVDTVNAGSADAADLRGQSGHDSLTGTAGMDRLVGELGNDVLDGLGGADELIGGTGNDTYVVDNAGDVVVELDGEGIDTVQTSLDGYVLGAHLEKLTLIGGALSGFGNSLDNTLVGNGLDNWLDGGAGADIMQGGAGNDTYVVDNAGDVISDIGGGVDTVRTTLNSYTLGSTTLENLTFTGTGDFVGVGTSLANVITGGAGNDRLSGLGGTDTTIGGLGDDTHVVAQTGDIVVELAGQGYDTVETSISYVLAAGVSIEAMVATGAAAVALTGNELDNSLTGNGAANVLNGGEGADAMAGAGGSDTYYVDNAGDTVVELAGGGIDTVYASVDFTLGAEVERLTLTGTAIAATGNGLNNILIGNGQDNVLNGMGGADSMQGGLGNDTYYVDHVGDQVIEAGSGVDSVLTTLNSYTLGGAVENLTFIGSGAFTGTGNTGANTLVGGAGDDTLVGLSGNDVLNGGLGADQMDGGHGNDIYWVDDAGDTITDIAGIDTVMTTRSYTLSGSLENIVYVGTGAVSLTGNGLGNSLTGGDLADYLKGLGGDDILIGGGGDDNLDGSVGNDLLDGGTGADTMDGGAGNDTYVVDDEGDAITEGAGGGNDRVLTTLLTRTLAANLEDLVFIGSGDFSGTGNSVANLIVGGAGADTLSGLGGNDNLQGGAGADTLDGGDGNDTLDGGTGADSLTGGAGNDVYLIDDAGDVIVELAAGGTDTARVTASSYVLGAEVEIMQFVGTGSFTGTGNALVNTIIGGDQGDTLSGGAGGDSLRGGGGGDTLFGGLDNDKLYGEDGNDFLHGEAGNDNLYGGAGVDTLTGGAGRDVFVIQAVSDTGVGSGARDVITDWDVQDVIDLRALDAIAGGGDDAFLYRGNGAFTGGGVGEVRWEQTGGVTLVQGDLNGDGVVDFEVELTGLHTLNNLDFLL